jgi:hypothetical protein
MSNSRRNMILAVVGLATIKTSAKPANKGDSGPYCWAGQKDGKDVFVTCGSKLGSVSAADQDWLTLDLSGVGGIRIAIEGKGFYISRREILTALAESSDSAKP